PSARAVGDGTDRRNARRRPRRWRTRSDPGRPGDGVDRGNEIRSECSGRRCLGYEHRLLCSVAARRDRPLLGNRDVHGGRSLNRGLGLAVCAGLLLTASAAEAVSADRPRVAPSVTPARLALAAPGSRRINVRNDGAEQIVIDVLRRTAATRWLQISPESLLLGPGRSAVLTVRAKAGPDAEPGDHHVLVLLTTRPQHGSRVALRLRLGVLVSVRMPGSIVRRLALGGIRVHRRRGLR